ncbi:hypothetical protein GCM10009115_09250 [Sphingopyxis soli]|uniref:Uncharacterized protein n=1 Tax=Sphingopyxis soli TaxID=592051 RepID=A0ABN1M004_9SPHN|nr:hypothetical protein [Sphingopyxis soli]
MHKKGTVLIPSGPSHDPNRKHLHVVCTDPDANGEQLIVSICTKVNNLCDPACTIQPHEHSWLTKESYVFYRKAQIVPQAALANGIAGNHFTVKDDMNGQTFLRIANGICASIQTPRKIKKYIGCP